MPEDCYLLNPPLNPPLCMGYNIHDTPELYTNRVEVALMMAPIAEAWSIKATCSSSARSCGA